MTIKRDISVGLGAITPQAWAQIVDKVNENASQRRFAQRDGQNKTFIAKITGATKVSGLAKWEYAFEQVRRVTATVTVAAVTDGITSVAYPTKKAINLLEVGNTATLAYGFIVTSGTVIASSPDYELKPVPINEVVEITARYDDAGVMSFEFCAPNPIDGACPIAGPGLVGGSSEAVSLTGTTLASNVVNSSLQNVGILAELAVLTPIDGSLAGNAYTANTLTNARAITLAGEASGTTNFDGSNNVTITTTIPLLDGGNY